MKAKTDNLPQVYLVGRKERLNFEESFVIFSGSVVKCGGVLEAIDLAYKSFYVFNLEFPNSCFGAWQFLDYSVYKMKPVCPIDSNVKMLSAFVGYD
jgi:hypothetical protein